MEPLAAWVVAVLEGTLAQHNLKRAEEERVSGLRSALRVISGARNQGSDSDSDSDSGESGVRSMCPFCGSRDPSPEAPCCSEWNVSIWTEAGAAEPEEPVSRWQQLGTQLEKLASVRERLGRASQLLVTLLASSIAALVVSLTMQSRAPADHTLLSLPKAPTSGEGSMPKDALLTLGGGEGAKSAAADHVPEPSQAVAQPVAAAEGVAPVAAEAAPAPSAPAAAPEPVAVALAPKEPEAPPVVAAPPPPAAPVAVEPPPPSAGNEKPAETVNPPAAKPQPAKRPAPKPAKVVVARAVPQTHAVAALPPPAAARTDAARAEESAESESPVVTTLIPDRDVARRTNEEASVAWREEKPLVELPRKTDAWVALRRGMSPAMVRRLLGEPKWKRHLVDTDVWLYEENSLFSDGWVAFSETEGGVLGWRHP